MDIQNAVKEEIHARYDYESKELSDLDKDEMYKFMWDGELTKQQAMIVALYRTHDMKEIGKILDIRPQAAKSAYNTGMEKLVKKRII